MGQVNVTWHKNLWSSRVDKKFSYHQIDPYAAFRPEVSVQGSGLVCGMHRVSALDLRVRASDARD